MGSGKTSILKAIAGLIKPSNGSIVFLKNIISSNTVLIPTGERENRTNVSRRCFISPL